MTVRDCREKKNGIRGGELARVKKSRGGNREVQDGKVCDGRRDGKGRIR